MTIEKQDFSMYAGDTKELVVTVTGDNDAPVNLTGASVKWGMRKNNVSGTVALSKTSPSGITLTSPSSGVFTVLLASADTLALSGKYYHEAEVTDNSSNVSTVLTGTVTITPSGV